MGDDESDKKHTESSKHYIQSLQKESTNGLKPPRASSPMPPPSPFDINIINESLATLSEPECTQNMDLPPSPQYSRNASRSSSFEMEESLNSKCEQGQNDKKKNKE